MAKNKILIIEEAVLLEYQLEKKNSITNKFSKKEKEVNINVKREIFLDEIEKLDKIDLVVLSCYGHVGIDYVGNLFDSNKQIIRFPPLSFFRKLKIAKKKRYRD